jgi:hypothetical protein
MKGPGGVVGSLLLFVTLVARPGEAAPPAASTLLAPSGTVTSTSVTFSWLAAENATFYFIHVNDAITAPRFTAWYPVGQVCASSSATCFVTITTGFAAGPMIWWIQTWNSDGFGPWSTGMSFTMTFTEPGWAHTISGADRFQLVLGNSGVLDRETGLVWQRSPATGTNTYIFAGLVCPFLAVGGRYGWRLPTIEELSSLRTETESGGVHLTAGHPFTTPPNIPYWTTTQNFSNLNHNLVVDFVGLWSPTTVDRSGNAGWWCVRGGAGASNGIVTP